MKNCILLLLIFLPVPVSAVPECPHDGNALSFFNRLTGAWQGQAVTTPVGPRPYDINFERRESLWIYGQANPGAAIHHWGFYCDGNQLWLRFLSTFRGNHDPTLLEAKSITATEIHFKAEHPDFLEVKVRAGQKHSQFEVLHHGDRHVLIELKRDTE